jgi:hypothetical protein
MQAGRGSLADRSEWIGEGMLAAARFATVLPHPLQNRAECHRIDVMTIR